MRRATAWRLAIIAMAVGLLEGLCRTGVIMHLTMPPPSEILRDLLGYTAAARANLRENGVI